MTMPIRIRNFTCDRSFEAIVHAHPHLADSGLSCAVTRPVVTGSSEFDVGMSLSHPQRIDNYVMSVRSCCP